MNMLGVLKYTVNIKEAGGKSTTDHDKSHKGQSALSAPSKINSNKDELMGDLEDDERISVVNYEPSDSSDDFQLQVNRTWGDTGESSKARELWLTRSEFSEIVDKGAILNSEQKKTSEKTDAMKEMGEKILDKNNKNKMRWWLKWKVLLIWI
jgi:hypothetical protein